jgi:hypothetical protein
MVSKRKISKQARRSQASMREFRMGEMIVRISVSRADEAIRGKPKDMADRARSAPPSAKKELTIGALLHSGLVGMWANRKDLPDSRLFAARLRRQAERRGNR